MLDHVCFSGEKRIFDYKSGKFAYETAAGHRRSWLSQAVWREFDGRDGPLPFVASDGDAQAMCFVEPNAFNRTGLAVGQDHGITDKLSLGLLEFAENRARAFLRDWHDGRSTNRED